MAHRLVLALVLQLVIDWSLGAAATKGLFDSSNSREKCMCLTEWIKSPIGRKQVDQPMFDQAWSMQIA